MEKKSGFTIIEVLLALFILVSALYVLSGTQIRMVQRVMRRRDEIDRIFLLKKEWYAAFILPWKEGRKPVKRLVSNPEVRIITDKRKLKKSLLNPTAKKDEDTEVQDPLLQISTTGEWQMGTYKERMTLLGFVYTPSKKEEKKS